MDEGKLDPGDIADLNRRIADVQNHPSPGSLYNPTKSLINDIENLVRKAYQDGWLDGVKYERRYLSTLPRWRLR